MEVYEHWTPKSDRVDLILEKGYSPLPCAQCIIHNQITNYSEHMPFQSAFKEQSHSQWVELFADGGY